MTTDENKYDASLTSPVNQQPQPQSLGGLYETRPPSNRRAAAEAASHSSSCSGVKNTTPTFQSYHDKSSPASTHFTSLYIISSSTKKRTSAYLNKQFASSYVDARPKRMKRAKQVLVGSFGSASVTGGTTSSTTTLTSESSAGNNSGSKSPTPIFGSRLMDKINSVDENAGIGGTPPFGGESRSSTVSPFSSASRKSPPTESAEAIGGVVTSEEPFVTEPPDSPEIMSESYAVPPTFASSSSSSRLPPFHSRSGGLLQSTRGSALHTSTPSVMTEKRTSSSSSYHHSSSNQRKEVYESRNGKEIQNSKQVSSHSDLRQDSREEVEALDRNGQRFVDAKQGFFTHSKSKSSLEALDAGGKSVKQLTASMQQLGGVKSASFVKNGTAKDGEIRQVGGETRFSGRALTTSMETDANGQTRGTITGSTLHDSGDAAAAGGCDDPFRLITKIATFQIDPESGDVSGGSQPRITSSTSTTTGGSLSAGNAFRTSQQSRVHSSQQLDSLKGMLQNFLSQFDEIDHDDHTVIHRASASSNDRTLTEALPNAGFVPPVSKSANLPRLVHQMQDEGMLDALLSYADADDMDQDVKMLSMHIMGRAADDPAVLSHLSSQKRGIRNAIKFAVTKGSDESKKLGSGLLEKMLNTSEDTCSRIVDSGGLDAVLEASRSSDVETRRNCALALLNLSMFGGAENRIKMIKHRAQEWLYPLAFDQKDVCTKYFSFLALGVLIAHKELEASLAHNDTLSLVDEFVQQYKPSEVAEAYKQLSSFDAKQDAELLRRMLPNLESRIPQAQQLAAFHFATEAYAHAAAGSGPNAALKRAALKDMGAIDKLRWCACYPNAQAAQLALETLAILHEKPPAMPPLSQQVQFWQSESVRNWCLLVGFKRLAQALYEANVDGEFLLLLNDAVLREEFRMESLVDRRKFLRELEHVRILSDYSGCDPQRLRDLLRAVGSEFVQYTYNLVRSGVDKRVLPLLTDEHLRADAQISNGIHRLHILEAIKRKYILTGSNNASAAAAAAASPHPLGSQQILSSQFNNGSQQQAGMLQQSETDVFISYRRSTGALLASLLKVHLQMRGFAVFIDIERLEAGAFDQKLLESIRSAKHFILVLSHKALDRCLGDGDRKDWIHKEICAALENNCNIVPIIDVDFEWPRAEDLPEDMRDVVKFNGVRWIHDYQDACVDKLERFLKRQLNVSAGIEANSRTGQRLMRSAVGGVSPPSVVPPTQVPINGASNSMSPSSNSSGGSRSQQSATPV